jgi:hypothetical protein
MGLLMQNERSFLCWSDMLLVVFVQVCGKGFGIHIIETEPCVNGGIAIPVTMK